MEGFQPQAKAADAKRGGGLAAKGEREMSFLQRAIVRRGHPKHIIVSAVGAIWGFYFLWFHNWIWALAAVLLSGFAGRMLTLGMKEESLAQTTLGKIMLLHLNPVNLIIQIVGSCVLVYGIWTHSVIYVMAAVSIILLGHSWGWHKVNEAL
jgi:hypothetical protein